MSNPVAPRHFIRHLAIVLVVNTVIAAAMTLSGRGPLAYQLVMSHAIGITTWALIDFGRLAVRRDNESGWPAGWRAFALPALGVVVGNLAGGKLGDTIVGGDRWAAMFTSADSAVKHVFLLGGIGALVSYFFWTTGRARHYAEALVTTRRDAAEAQLMLLQSQLEPHMLFNTLANLRALIATDPPRAQELLDHLIAFLRSTLASSRATLHPLSAEFDRTADYLALMKVRMGDRLTTTLDLPDDLAAVPVPTLLLQPLVENAIKHGLEPHVDGGRLIVRARGERGQLVIEVRDTGAGLDAPAAHGTRFGLTHVRERLATKYGPAASMTLAPAADGDGGALATVRLPLETTR
ncbi:sensor histidine kinase [Rhizobacter sp. Root1221]|uniref:sensor histidine kinase n=1 Tax=Rhizobacter sp. Root1221 TaxID=1736433 RepID=UPI0006F43F8F|nr:histidine kinase [Rhizobacter sp. Root1221]KQW02259.1 hypothetical protein ASC87_13610 [Rhizobacter sp. Root1221]